MTTRRGLVVAAIVMAAVSAACTPQELGDFFAVEDLRTRDDPTAAAAGHAPGAIDADRAAQQLVDEGLREKDREKLERAYEQRPWDARYPIYLAAMAYADGDSERYLDIFWESSSRYVQMRSMSGNADVEQMYAEWLLLVLGGFDRALVIETERRPSEPSRADLLEAKFCAILSFYLDRYDTASRDALGYLFVSEAACDGAW